MFDLSFWQHLYTPHHRWCFSLLVFSVALCFFFFILLLLRKSVNHPSPAASPLCTLTCLVPRTFGRAFWRIVVLMRTRCRTLPWRSRPCRTFFWTAEYGALVTLRWTFGQGCWRRFQKDFHDTVRINSYYTDQQNFWAFPIRGEAWTLWSPETISLWIFPKIFTFS